MERTHSLDEMSQSTFDIVGARRDMLEDLEKFSQIPDNQFQMIKALDVWTRFERMLVLTQKERSAPPVISTLGSNKGPSPKPAEKYISNFGGDEAPSPKPAEKNTSTLCGDEAPSPKPAGKTWADVVRGHKSWPSRNVQKDKKEVPQQKTPVSKAQDAGETQPGKTVQGKPTSPRNPSNKSIEDSPGAKETQTPLEQAEKSQAAEISEVEDSPKHGVIPGLGPGSSPRPAAFVPIRPIDNNPVPAWPDGTPVRPGLLKLSAMVMKPCAYLLALLYFSDFDFEEIVKGMYIHDYVPKGWTKAPVESSENFDDKNLNDRIIYLLDNPMSTRDRSNRLKINGQILDLITHPMSTQDGALAHRIRHAVEFLQSYSGPPTPPTPLSPEDRETLQSLQLTILWCFRALNVPLDELADALE